MKKEEAEKLICPFIQDAAIVSSTTEYQSCSANIYCITNKCMGWKRKPFIKIKKGKCTTSETERFIEYLSGNRMMYEDLAIHDGCCMRLEQ